MIKTYLKIMEMKENSNKKKTKWGMFKSRNLAPTEAFQASFEF